MNNMGHMNRPTGHDIYMSFKDKQMDVVKDLLERIERLESRVLELESLKSAKGEVDW